MKRIICLLISILIILILILNIPIFADSTNLDETNENELEEIFRNSTNSSDGTFGRVGFTLDSDCFRDTNISIAVFGKYI